MTGLDTGSPFYLLPFSRRKGQKLVEGSPHSISHSNTVALLVSCLPEALWHTSPYRSCGQLTSSMLSSTGWVNLLEKVHHWVTALQRVLVANFLSGSSVDQQFHCHVFAAQLLFLKGSRWLAVNLQDVIGSLWTEIFLSSQLLPADETTYICMNSRKSYVLHEVKGLYSDEQTVKDFSVLDLWAKEIKSSTAYVWGVIRRWGVSIPDDDKDTSTLDSSYI